jgi:hypothetical protein
MDWLAAGGEENDDCVWSTLHPGLLAFHGALRLPVAARFVPRES